MTNPLTEVGVTLFSTNAALKVAVSVRPETLAKLQARGNPAILIRDAIRAAAEGQAST